MQIYGPPDVVAGVVAVFRGQGGDGRTRVLAVRAPGMVRVAPVGGEPDNLHQDRPRVLVQVWRDDQPASFTLCRSLCAGLAAIDSQDALPGLVTHHIEPATMPLQF